MLLCCHCGVLAAGVDVLSAVGQFNDKDFSAASFRQLQPVMPQRPLDVQPDVAYFVNDVSGNGFRARICWLVVWCVNREDTADLCSCVDWGCGYFQ